MASISGFNACKSKSLKEAKNHPRVIPKENRDESMKLL
jgi:hypothetical protein